MRKTITIILLAVFVIAAFVGLSYADSKKTWANVGKGLAIYEGVKVLTGRQGNIVDDVTGGMQPRQSQQQAPAQGDSSYQDSYNAGYKAGYESGYNAGFRAGIEQTSGKK
jgi:hypothetical protein